MYIIKENGQPVHTYRDSYEAKLKMLQVADAGIKGTWELWHDGKLVQTVINNF